MQLVDARPLPPLRSQAFTKPESAEALTTTEPRIPCLRPLRCSPSDEVAAILTELDILEKSRPRPAPHVPRRLQTVRALLPTLYPIGVGTIWCGRRWPPQNTDWKEPTQIEVNQHLHSAVMEVASSGNALLLDTAEGYGESEERVGAWLKSGGVGLHDRIVICTKFGERHDCSTGSTALDHSAGAAERAFHESVRRLGRVDVFYSHVTSQLSERQAAKVLADQALAATLARLRRESGCLLGCSLSHESVLEEALRGKAVVAPWLAMLDVMQLPAVLALKRPDLVIGLAALGLDVVVNSPVRGMERMQGMSGVSTPREVITTLLAMKGITAVLSGSRAHLRETLQYCRGQCE